MGLKYGLAVLAAASGSAGQVSFHLVGDLGGASGTSLCAGVSADGNVVTGYCSSPQGGVAFRWTERDGLAALQGGWLGAQGLGISGDGLVIVGQFGQAWRWTAAGGMQGLGYLPGYTYASAATSANRDGSAVAGASAAIGDPVQAFLWTPQALTPLGFLDDAVKVSNAKAVADDAMVVVGNAKSPAFAPTTFEAFRWTPGTGMIGLGTLPGDGGSVAWDVSADGSVVVGSTLSDLAGLRQPFRWTPKGGMVGLGFLPRGNDRGRVRACSADGSVAVGYNGNDDPDSSTATVWDAAHGVRLISDILTAHGVDTDGLTLGTATGISDDGSVIVGYGYRPPDYLHEGWVARIPKLCRADCDIDGDLDIDDFICFQTRFATGHIYGDCDIDGLYTIDDFICFQTWFAVGCE